MKLEHVFKQTLICAFFIIQAVSNPVSLYPTFPLPGYQISFLYHVSSITLLPEIENRLDFLLCISVRLLLRSDNLRACVRKKSPCVMQMKRTMYVGGGEKKGGGGGVLWQ